jgi:hypothetical protein
MCNTCMITELEEVGPYHEQRTVTVVPQTVSQTGIEN